MTTRIDSTSNTIFDSGSFFEVASLLYPSLTPVLTQVWVDNFTIFGDSSLAIAAVRQDPSYETVFPGLRRPDGTLRMTEAEYSAELESFADTISGVGLDPNAFGNQFVSLIEGNVSAREFKQRVDDVNTQIVNNLAGVRIAFAEEFGLTSVDDAAIYASLLDPELGLRVLNNEIPIAQIKGEAAQQGFQLSTPSATRLRNAGLDQQASGQLFFQARTELPGLQRAARRFAVGGDTTFDLEEFTGARAFGDVGQINRIGQLRRAERSLFSRGGQIRQDQLGRLTGLRER